MARTIRWSAAAALAIAGALLYWFALRGHAAATPAPTQTGSAAGSSAVPSSATKSKPVDKVRRITKEERAELAKQIETARAARQKKMNDAEGHDNFKKPDPVPELPESSETIVKTTMKAAMQEVIPMLAECYDERGSALAPKLDLVADLTLTGDPDLGTIVEADIVKNLDGTTDDPQFIDCIRTTLATLELPPLSEGDAVKVTYPFAFARDDSTMPP